MPPLSLLFFDHFPFSHSSPSQQMLIFPLHAVRIKHFLKSPSSFRLQNNLKTITICAMTLTSNSNRKNRTWDSEYDLLIHLQEKNRILRNQNEKFNYFNNTLLHKFLVNHPNADSELSQFTSASSTGILQSQLLHLQDQIRDHTATEEEEEEEEEEELVLSDPQYKYFLNHLTPHGKSYVLEIVEDGVFVKYENESSSSSSLVLNAHANYRSKLRVRKSKGENPSAVKSPNVNINRVASNSRKYRRGKKLQGAKFFKNRRVNSRDMASNGHKRRKKSKQIGTTSCIEIKRVKEEIEDYDDAIDIRRRSMESPTLVEQFWVDNQANEFREKLMKELSRPYREEEHKRLFSDFRIRKPVQSCKDLRGSMKIYEKDYAGKSYQDHNLDLAYEIDSAGDDPHKVLNLLRGFFFWLGNLTQEGAFMPWRDPTYLDTTTIGSKG